MEPSPSDGFNAEPMQRADRGGIQQPMQPLRFGSLQADGGSSGLDEFEMLASYLTTEEGQYGGGECR